jgi:hypothetical protein
MSGFNSSTMLSHPASCSWFVILPNVAPRLLGLTSFLLAVYEWPAGCIVFLGVGVQLKALASLQPGAYAMARNMLRQVGAGIEEI